MDIVAHRGEGKLQHVIEIGKHRLLTDVGPSLGGEDSGPEPHDLLAASLAACTAVTLAMYARRKNWDLQDIRVQIEHKHEGDAYVMNRRLHYIGNLDAQQRSQLTEIAKRCPVHKTLVGEIRILTEEA